MGMTSEPPIEVTRGMDALVWSDMAVPLLLNLPDVPGSGPYGQILRNQEIAAISVGDLNYVTASAQTINIFLENDFH